VKELHLKRGEIRNFQTEPYTEFIVHDYYLVVSHNIYYLYDDKPLGDGILDGEELVTLPDLENKDGFMKMPVRWAMKLGGSDQFCLMFNQMDTKKGRGA